MKKLTLATGLLALVGVGSLGCKSTPKVAWWKSDKAAESTAVAHTAPALPSDLAKQSTTTTATGAPQVAIGEAAPFVPGQVARTSTAAAPAGYPSTDAPPFAPDVASRIVSTPTTSTAGQASSAATLGSIAASPYNPAAAPRPSVPVTSGSTASVPESRYGFASTAGSAAPAYGQPVTGAVASTGVVSGAAAATPGVPAFDPTAVASRYTPFTTPATTPTTPTTPFASVSAPAVDAASAYANRYASAATGAANVAGARVGDVMGAAATLPGSAATTPVQTATTAVATTAQPYRPGGTGTYPSTGGTYIPPAVQVASRPAPTAGAVPSSTTLPGASTSGTGTTTAPPVEAPRYR